MLAAEARLEPVIEQRLLVTQRITAAGVAQLAEPRQAGVVERFAPARQRCAAGIAQRVGEFDVRPSARPVTTRTSPGRRWWADGAGQVEVDQLDFQAAIGRQPALAERAQVLGKRLEARSRCAAVSPASLWIFEAS